MQEPSEKSGEKLENRCIVDSVVSFWRYSWDPVIHRLQQGGRGWGPLGAASREKSDRGTREDALHTNLFTSNGVYHEDYPFLTVAYEIMSRTENKLSSSRLNTKKHGKETTVSWQRDDIVLYWWFCVCMQIWRSDTVRWWGKKKSPGIYR